MKPWHIALAYVALSVLALALLAVPLFDAWRVHVGPLRVFVPQDMQALPELFRREGADAVAAAVRSRSDPSGREVIVFAGPGKEVLAGTLRRWPTEIPDAPGTYGQVIDRGDGSLMRIIVSHEVLPGGYQLIMGRQGEGLSLQGHFGYGIAAAMMIVLALGTALAWLLARSASAARAAEERYARAMEASEEAHWDWIIPTDEYYAARSHFHIYGLPPDFQYAGRAQFLAAAPFHPEDRAKYAQAVNALFASRESRLTMDLRLLLGGETRWVQIRGMCTRDASGVPVRYTGTVRDITDRKRLDLALADSEARFRSLTELSSDFFWETDAEHRYTAIELGWAYAGVRNQASKLGRARWEIAYASPDEAAWAAHRAAIAARSRFVDFRFSRIEEGEERFYEHSGEPRYDAQGNFLGYRGVGRDVTARKRAEMALRKSEERYARVMQASEDGFWEWVVATDEFYASPRMLALYGLPPDTVFRGRADFLSRFPFHPEDLELWRKAVAAHLAGGTARVDLEVRSHWQSETRWIHLTAICQRDASGAEERWTGSVSDVTERRRAQEALRASEERYSLAMEASEEGHFDVNLDTDEHFISERLNEIHGFPPGRRTAKRSEFIKQIRFYGDDARKYHAAIAAAEAKNGPERYECEFRIVRPSGEVRWLRTRGKVMRDAEGRARRRTGVVADITERKLAAEALRDSEARFRALAESALAGIYLIQENRFRYVNPAMATMFGYTPEELVDRLGPADLVHPHDRALVAENIRRRVEGEVDEIRYEFRGVRRDGSVFPVEVHGRRIEFGGKPGVMGALVDNTERKRAVDELRESEARFRGLTELSSDWYWEQDENLRFTYLSRRANDLTGYSGDSSIGKTRWELAGMTPLSCTWPEHQAVLAARQPFRDLETRRVAPDGTIRYLSMSGAPIFDEHGRFKGYHGIGRNITERKRAEEKLRESEALKSAMFETALDCIISIDHDGRVIEFNPAAERTFGYRRAEAMGKELAELIIPPRLREQHRRGLARYLATGEGPVLGTRVEMSAVRADGAEFPVELSVTRIPAEGAPLFTAYLRDITERKRAEEKLRESEARFRSLTQISSDWYWRQDENLRFTYLSEGVSERAGWPGEDYIGRLRWEVPGIHLISGSWEEHKEVLAKRRPFRDLEYWRPGTDGPVYTSISGAPIFDEQGRFKGYQGVGRNITQRKRFEEALRLSEARYARAMNASADGLWEWNAATDELFISPRARELWGIPDGVEIRTRAELKAQNLQFTEDTIRECIAQRSGVEMTYSVLNQAGELRWVRSVGKVFLGEHGEPTLVTGSLTDVTERKLAADALRLSEEELRARQDMLDLAQKAASAVAFEWRIGVGEGENRWSPDLEVMYGLEPGSYDGTYETWKKLVLPADWPAVEAAIKRASETGDVAAEYRVVHPDGSVHWLHAKGRMFVDAEGKPARMVGFMHDVTQRRHAEEALRLSEERYALAVASADEGIFDWDLRTDRVYVSRRAQELLGRPGGELWNPRREWRHILNFHPEDAKLQHDRIKALIAGETSTYDVEFRIILPDGSHRWFRQRAIALRDAAGKAHRMVGSIADITDRKRSQEELQRLERQLRQAQRLEAMGTLAGGIAHDFNNILGAILGYGEMALRAAPKGSRLARDLDSIIVAGERGRALVDRVLAFSRSAVGERVAVHVEKVAREALDLVSAKLPPNITLHTVLRAGRSAILGDATQVHQVLMNLATNAVQAMPGGGTLRVSLDVSRVDASRVPAIGVLAAESEYLVLRVADTGTGIAPDILERIFDPFFTTKEVGTGTGLGLSLVHGIVAELGGAIDVASTPGAGSTFTVYLPRSGETVEARQDEEPEMPRGDGQRVLIVDDEEPLVRLATRTLEELGYAPVGFTSSSAALAAFRADPQRFDALITDERMPGMSGSALIREVRGIRSSMPVVLMSGYLGATARKAREGGLLDALGKAPKVAVAIGADEVLQKPLSARDLATSLARVLQL